MKNIKKLLAVLIAVVMTVSLLAACGGDSGTTTNTDKPEGTTAEQTDEKTEPVTEAKTDEVTTEPVTTDEVTEAPELVLYDVYRWDFDDASDLGWVSSNMTDVSAGEDGTMKLVCKGGDPNITTKRLNVNIDCDKVEYITMRVKNCTDNYSCQLFISTTDSPGPNESYSLKFEHEYADEDNEWEILEIDTLDINGWSGTLKSLRFDYTDGSEGEYYIDYIALQTTVEKDAGGVETEEDVDPRAGKELLYKWDLTTLTAEDMYLASQPHDEDTEADENEGEEEEEDPRWHFSNGVEDAYVENGHLVIKIGAIDPFMVTPKLTTPFDCSAVTAVVIKGCNKTDMTLGQFFFRTEDTDSFSEAGSVRFSFEKQGADNEEWEEIVLKPSDSVLWDGQLDYIRIDPSEAHEGIVLLDSIELWGSAQ